MIYASVIIPTFKRVEQTIRTINLLLKSRGINKKFKLEIVVSDSSPDDKVKEAVEKKFKNDTVVFIKPFVSGIAANKNQGAEIAKHPILIFCDSDIEVFPDTVENTLNALRSHSTVAAIGGEVIWKGGSQNKKLDRPRIEDRMLTIGKTTYVEAIYSRFMATYKKIFKNVGGYDDKVFNMRGEGSDLSIRYWRAGYPLVFEKAIKVNHVYEVKEGIIRKNKHPEWGIAKDYLLLGYKYDMFDMKEIPENFVKTINKNFSSFGNLANYRIIEGITKNLDLLIKVKPAIDHFKRQTKSKYDFKFLEVFSDKNIFNRVIEKADKIIHPIKIDAFK